MIEINNMTCGYKGSFFLNKITLRVEEGEIVGIIGPNGSGKTTLLRAISRVLRPASGSIELNGREIWSIGPGEMAKQLAVVSQRSEAVLMDVEEYVLLGRIPHKGRLQFIETEKDLEIAEHCMELTDTTKVKGHPMNKISGGERQLALIARALTQEPKLLLLDEPMTHLDISHQVKLLDLIKRLNRDMGLTVIMVLHDLNLASEYCNKLALLKEGRIRKVGTPEEVIDYKIIEEVYKTVVVIKNNPISSRPYLFVVSEEERNRERK